MGEGTGQEEQKTSGEGANTTFWDQLHLTVPSGGCRLPGNQAQGASECQAWPRPEPTAWQGLAVPSSCLYEVQLTPKRANPAFHPQHMVP